MELLQSMVILIMLLLTVSLSFGKREGDSFVKYCPLGQFAFAMQIKSEKQPQPLLGMALYCEKISTILGLENTITDDTVRIQFDENAKDWNTRLRCPHQSGIMGIDVKYGKHGEFIELTVYCGAPFDSEQNRTTMNGTKSRLSEYNVPLSYVKDSTVYRKINEKEMSAISKGFLKAIGDSESMLVNKINSDPRMGDDKYTVVSFKAEIEEAFKNSRKQKFFYNTGPDTSTSINQLTIYAGEHRVGLKKCIMFENGRQVPNTSTGGGSQKLNVFFVFCFESFYALYSSLD
ncbi:uncharacterized protein CELE_T04B8.1 [Caenorhabditis elegans]|uniref:Uncharacterized protein n=1 Tax=Caenorhabditis elegans TaxID=6239 RepID=O44849_CAEEL|nr:Uncharacterized protein CELE_T04B8.1 [Caenorhabditis elegans]CCD72776.2 Uncharacterized protein CELE_T04B8.1 [Caenorhabditis elegans]